MHFSGEGDEVMLTHGKNLDVLDDHELVVVFGEEGVVDDALQILFVTFGEVEHGLCVPRWRVEETLAVRVLADAFEDCADAVEADVLINWWPLRVRGGEGGTHAPESLSRRSTFSSGVASSRFFAPTLGHDSPL